MQCVQKQVDYYKTVTFRFNELKSYKHLDCKRMNFASAKAQMDAKTKEWRGSRRWKKEIGQAALCILSSYYALCLSLL